jgi:large subunit ribosomal protein L18
MSEGPRYRVPFRRRREGRTDYRSRLALLRGARPRAVVRFTNRRVLVAVTEFNPGGDRVVAAADSRELTGIGFPVSGLSSTPAAYLTGYLAGLRAVHGGATVAVLDTGLRHPSTGGRLFGALKGLIDAGVEIPHGEKGFPATDRLNGSHLRPPLPRPLEAFRGELPNLSQRPKESP